MRRYRAYILDLDGTLYRGDEAIEHATGVVRELSRRGALVRYLTNNSGRTREFFTEKLSRMGFPVEPNEVYSSGIGTAKYLVQNRLGTAFVVGEEGLKSTLSSMRIEVVGACGPADAVVAGICRSFTYDWMNDAMQLIKAGSAFVATNPDATFPLEGGALVPGAGSIVAAIRACSETEPFVVGKPNPYLIDLILREANLDPSDALVVGDRLDTDIESGRRAGCDTFLVLTGVTNSAPVGQAHAEDLTGLLID